MEEVLEAEKLADEATKMKAIHAMSGTYLVTLLRNEPRCPESIDDMIRRSL
jgi:hypothetical protein